MKNYFILFLFQLWIVRAFLLYNTLFPLYRTLNNHIQGNLLPKLDASNETKLIISTPGGLYGFYLLGISSYIKRHQDLSKYIFSGASAGAWNSLFLAFKGNDTEFIDNLLKTNLQNATSILQIEKRMKQYILENYNESDFDLEKINIGVTVMKFPFRFKLKIYNNFTNLNDTLDCCIASSHIPFITGGLIHKYRKQVSFDGGFFKYPYVKSPLPSFTIHAGMWNSSYTVSNCSNNPLLQTKNHLNFTKLYLEGYKDSNRNRQTINDAMR
jgi:hypothetical protein